MSSIDETKQFIPLNIAVLTISDTRTLADEDGFFSDWIEVYNPSAFAVNLDGWSLTDNNGNLTKWKF
ncbi:MAG: hypothetical protein ACK463_17005, partial [Bradyrhizobium sp.]